MLVTLDSITTKITKGTTPTSVGCTFENSGVNFIKSESLGNSRNIDRSKFATVYKGNIIKNLIMDCQSYTKYRPNETTGGIFVPWRRKEELPTGA